MLGKVFRASGIEFETKIEGIDDVVEKDSEILLSLRYVRMGMV
jgi:hypothetical protein